MLKKPVLIDEEEAGEEEEKDSRALKRKRRKKALPFILVDVFSKEMPSAKELDPSFFEATKEAGESSSHTNASLLDAAELLGVSIGPRSCSNNFKAFIDFAKLVSAKLDFFEVYSTREDRSFVFGFRHMVNVKT